MTFSDILKKSFLEGYSMTDLDAKKIVYIIAITAVIGIYIYLCYRVMTRKTFYSKSFSISLVAMAVITAAIILTIQSSVVVSLGMVGALSIVRFRTAIKDPMDLVFLFWSISIGIICGAGLIKIAVIVSLILTVILIILNKIPMVKAPKILVVNAEYSDDIDKAINAAINSKTRAYEEKTRRINADTINIIYEIRIKDGGELVKEVRKVTGITSVSLLSHDGEVVF